MGFATKKEFVDFVTQLGGITYLVGGCIRDSLLSLKFYDEDFVITGLNENNPFDKQRVGKDFPVYLISIGNKKSEVALARTERKIGTKHTDFKIYCEDVSIEKDLSRRDLTINAIALNLVDNTFYDPYNGITDLKNRVIRHISNAFMEDPLRVYRVARFSAKFPNFTVANDTLHIMKTMKESLKNISPEKVFKELEKAMEYDNFSCFFQTLKNCDCLSVHFKEIEALTFQDVYGESIFNHVMNLLNTANTLPIIKFGLLCYYFGKNLTNKNLHTKHYYYNPLGVNEVNNFCDRLKIPKKQRKIGILAIKLQTKIIYIHKMELTEQFNFINEYLDVFKQLVEISNIVISARNSEVTPLDPQYIKTAILSVKEANNSISGRDLIESGYEPSVKFKELLNQKRISYFIKIMTKKTKNRE